MSSYPTDEFEPKGSGRFAESFRAERHMACQACPDTIEPGDWIVQAHHDPISRGRGYVHDECAD